MIPDNLGCIIIIPLGRGEDLDMTRCENYGGIVLSPGISKLFKSDKYLWKSVVYC